RFLFNPHLVGRVDPAFHSLNAVTWRQHEPLKGIQADGDALPYRLECRPARVYKQQREGKESKRKQPGLDRRTVPEQLQRAVFLHEPVGPDAAPDRTRDEAK